VSLFCFRRRLSESLKDRHREEQDQQEKDRTAVPQFSQIESVAPSPPRDQDGPNTHGTYCSSLLSFLFPHNDDAHISNVSCHPCFHSDAPLLQAWEENPTAASKEQEVMWSRLLSIRSAAMELKHRIERNMEDISQEDSDTESTGASGEATRDDAFDDDTMISSDVSMVEMTPSVHRGTSKDHVLHDEVPAKPGVYPLSSPSCHFIPFTHMHSHVPFFGISTRFNHRVTSSPRFPR
jgi:hypothetical protein